MFLPRLASDPMAPFPPADLARVEPNGLLAIGGDLSPARLMNAYRHGIFPWYSVGDPILWWSPTPRAVFDTEHLHLSRRQRRRLRHCAWEIHADRQFSEVIHACATIPRRGQSGTWIVPEMQQAYEALHALGTAHSMEIHADGQLIGGVYGVLAGPVFCGESMFSRVSGASTLALAALCRILQQQGIRWLDAQMPTRHLMQLGVLSLPRNDYLRLLDQPAPALPPCWDTLVQGWQAHDFS